VTLEKRPGDSVSFQPKLALKNALMSRRAVESVSEE